MPHRRAARVYRGWHGGLTPEQQSMLRTVWIVLPFMLIGIAAIAMLMYSLTRPLRAPAPFTFSQAVYQPVKAAVCPGETLRWPIRFVVRRAPVMVISIRSIWDIEKNQTVILPPETTGGLVFTNYTEPTEVDRMTELVIPEMPPGKYQVRAAAQEFNSQAAAYSVPFTVREDCGV